MLTRPHSYIDNLCVPFRHLCFATKLAWLQGWCWRLGGAETLLPEWLHSTSRWLESLTLGKSVPQFLQALAQLTAHLLAPHQCYHQCDKQADNHADEDRLPETTHLYTSCSASIMTFPFSSRCSTYICKAHITSALKDLFCFLANRSRDSRNSAG